MVRAILYEVKRSLQIHLCLVESICSEGICPFIYCIGALFTTTCSLFDESRFEDRAK